MPGRTMERGVRILQAPARAEARKRVEQFRDCLGNQVPETMTGLGSGFEKATHFYAFPKEHWHRIRSTKGFERFRG